MLSDFWNIGHHAVVSSSAQLLSKKSWQAVRACGLARTYSTKETADAGRVDFQAAGVISVWQGLQNPVTLLREVLTVESQVKVIQLV